MMVGLSIVLEAQRGSSISKKTLQVINKTMMLSNMNKHSPSAVSFTYFYYPFQEHTFLDLCFLCCKRLLPGKDIYMYNVECRWQQIFMDEEGTIQKENCSFAAMKPKQSSSSSSSHEQQEQQEKGARNCAAGFAY
ncbi:putative Zf-FLZ domain-containing protein [Lupinus albus]|uniref:Putative Zf-FLZ domain-containing protein n=1 Tax=Lupinus albus TaxID=3870 RepID=A0A6A4PDX8_LUPAL|nr:putative Zf-FLZ domain-containing protein [Lupinus albus]